MVPALKKSRSAQQRAEDARRKAVVEESRQEMVREALTAIRRLEQLAKEKEERLREDEGDLLFSAEWREAVVAVEEGHLLKESRSKRVERDQEASSVIKLGQAIVENLPNPGPENEKLFAKSSPEPRGQAAYDQGFMVRPTSSGGDGAAGCAESSGGFLPVAERAPAAAAPLQDAYAAERTSPENKFLDKELERLNLKFKEYLLQVNKLKMAQLEADKQITRAIDDGDVAAEKKAREELAKLKEEETAVNSKVEETAKKRQEVMERGRSG